jgi:hypothetical protein
LGKLPKTIYEINKKRKKKHKQKLNYERARQHQNGIPIDVE